MPIIKTEMVINAPRERIFDLARSIDLHEDTMTRHKNEIVTWKATHFGIRQKLTSKITIYDRPNYFRDSMIQGAFARFDHDHFFEEANQGIIMKDVFDCNSPLGILGNIADALFLEKYMKKLLEERNKLIKEIAESESWRKFLLP